MNRRLNAPDFLSLLALSLLLSCSMNVQRPHVTSVSISDGELIADVGSFRSIAISFSKRMNRYVTEENISISGYYGELHFVWSGGNRDAMLLLGEELEKGNAYRLDIGKNCECEEGFDLGTEASYAFYTYSAHEELEVLSTSPADGETLAVLDGASLAIRFSLPLEYTSILDKVSIEPALNCSYSFSDDRKTLVLNILEHVNANETYKVTLEDSLSALGGKSLREPYAFSFNSGKSEERFYMSGAVMVQEGTGPPGIDLDIGFLGKTGGVEKNMELLAFFSQDFYLSAVLDDIVIEPAVSYHLAKEERSLRFVFEQGLASGETYRITFGESISSSPGIKLDTEYVFEWKVDGALSCTLSPLVITIENPDIEEPDSLIFDNGTFYHNRPLLLEPKTGYCEVDFRIAFSSVVDVYRSLGGASLSFVYGNAAAVSGTLIGYVLDEPFNALGLTFSLPVLLSGGDAYYKLILLGGESGFVDRAGNTMEKDLEVYVLYDIPD